LSEFHEVWRDGDLVIEGAIGSGNAKILANLSRSLRDSLGGHAPGSDAGSKNASDVELVSEN